MGRGRKNRSRNRKKPNNDDGEATTSAIEDPPRRAYTDIEKENSNFETFYKMQGIVPPEEWESFMNSLRRNLPSAFRITGFKGQAKALLNIIKGKYIEGLLQKNLDRPFPLTWYPDNLAWQMTLSRVAIRSCEELHRLHNFLVSETATGDISRQETVSMIPPLLLDVQPHHKILDMCAAPGSKTAQLIELLHRDNAKIPDGFVVANDVDNKRCYMLVHQAKRLNSPCFMITNHDAANMPNLKLTKDGQRVDMKYDRILCDVPCSGDGTIRKTVDIWKKWNTANANGLHSLQIRILKRGLELLAVNGRIVYSTCSFNPVENEAVIAAVLQQTEGSCVIVDTSSDLPGLRSRPGLTQWKVTNKALDVFESYDDVPEKFRTQIRPSMFPPDFGTLEKLNLERCVRVLPHHQDTGGFFVTVIQKDSEYLPWEGEKSSDNCGPPMKKRKVWGYKEDPFVFFDDNENAWASMKDFYGLERFPVNQLLSRRKEANKKNLYFVSDAVRTIMQENANNVKIINTGVRMFCRSENKDAKCPFRLTQEGVATIMPFLNERIIKVELEDLVLLLTNENPSNDQFSAGMQGCLSAIESGCVILSYVGNEGTDDEFSIELCGWKGNQTLRCYVPKVGRAHYLRICGVDVLTYEDRDKKRFKNKEENTESHLEETIADHSHETIGNSGDSNNVT